MKRRDFLRHSAGALAAGIFLPLEQNDLLLAAGVTPLLAVAHGPDPAAVTRSSIEALGGMGRFVHRGDKVVIKANIGWDRTPEEAANTNPEVVGSLVRLALDAGAKSVLVLDNPCNDPRRCYLRSGIAEAVRASGGKIDFFEEDRTKKMAIRGEKVREWPVHPAFVEADVRINVPIAKHHALSGLTLGMKNWLGAIGGNRSRLHPEIGASIVDLAAFFLPSLTVVDAVRILTRGGPQGGSPDDVSRLDTVIASADPVAAEARGALLFPPKMARLPHIALAAQRGLGRATWDDSEERRVEVS